MCQVLGCRMLKKVNHQARRQTQRPPTCGGLCVPLTLCILERRYPGRMPVLEGSERTLPEEWGTHRCFIVNSEAVGWAVRRATLRGSRADVRSGRTREARP